MKSLSICSKTAVNQIAAIFKNFKNFKTLQLYTSDVSIHAIVTCIFVPVHAFADYFSLLLQHIVPSINSDL